LETIHLATVFMWRERMGELKMVVTHEAALGVAARSLGFYVRGV
jgi:hypothetical protein